MNTTRRQKLTAAALVGALPFTSAQPQVPLPKTAAEVPGPASGNVMTKEYVQRVGRMAYVSGDGRASTRTIGAARSPRHPCPVS